MAENIGMELNLAVGKINHVLPNFIPPTFYIKDSKCLHINVKGHFSNSLNTIAYTYSCTSLKD